MLPLRGEGYVRDRLNPFLSPKLRGFPQTIDGVMDEADMTRRKELEFVSTIGGRSATALLQLGLWAKVH